MTIRNEANAEKQRLREKTHDRLLEIFKAAAKVARGETRHRRIDGKMTPISVDQQ